MYRRIFIDIAYLTGATYGFMISWSIWNGQYYLQNDMLLMGSLLLFLLSFHRFVRKRVGFFAVVWCVLCFIWLFLYPIRASVPFFIEWFV